MHMRPFKRKSRLQRLLERAKDIDLPRPSDKAVRTGLLTAGGLSGLTAGSAGISSLRRRNQQERDDS
jgi:hypothetical protein